MAEQYQMSSEWNMMLVSKMVGQDIEGFSVKRVLGSGSTAVTYLALDDNGHEWALKLADADSFGERSPFRDVGRFSSVRDERYLALTKETGLTTLQLDGVDKRFYWFKSRPVEGQSLQDFLAEGNRFSVAGEIECFLRCITSALQILEQLGFAHGDMHSRNIMREVVGEKTVHPEVRYVLIDFSESHELREADGGLSSDLAMLGKHLHNFAIAASEWEDLRRDDERVLAAVSHVPGMLNGSSATSLGIRSAEDVYSRFTDNLQSVSRARDELLSPFESLSTEFLPSDSLIADLCFTEMSWTSKLEQAGNVLLIGPRGCGKTMIFRRMRLKTKLVADRYQDEVESSPYVGLYVPCESLFYLQFADLSQVAVEKHRKPLIAYFNVCIAAEVCSTLLVDSPLRDTLRSDFIAGVSTLLKEELGELWDVVELSVEARSIHDLNELTQRALRTIRNQVSRGEPAECLGSTDFVVRLVELLKKNAPVVAEKHIAIFLDDYTEERVPRRLQEALHQIVCQRSSEISYKISAHMQGSIYDSPRPLAQDEGRNIEVLNLGTLYLRRDRKAKEGSLLVQILNKRLDHCPGIEGTMEEWLGLGEWPDGHATISRALNDPDSRPKVKYHGTRILMDLCTGDYSEMIRMVGEIFADAGIEPTSKEAPRQPGSPITAFQQDAAIRRVSREYLARIRDIRPDGQRLFDITNAFGCMSSTLLRERDQVSQGKKADGSPRTDPYDLLDAFVDDLTVAQDSAQERWRRLQKASVFADIGIAPSQRSPIADRATLRRIYCPAFATTTTSSEHLQLTRRQFEWFMDEPYLFCKGQLKKVTAGEQLELWEKGAREHGRTVIREQFEKEVPNKQSQHHFRTDASKEWTETVNQLPGKVPIDRVNCQSSYDLLVLAMGFEERTTACAKALASVGVSVENTLLLELDRYPDETGDRRHEMRSILDELTNSKPYRPQLAPINSEEDLFSKPFQDTVRQIMASTSHPKILLDISSCPARILSEVLRVLLDFSCDLTILYSEAREYFPTLRDLQPFNAWAQGNPDEQAVIPIRGFEFFVAPPALQSGDSDEVPVLLVLFPTVSTARVHGVIERVKPAKRAWLFSDKLEEPGTFLTEAAKYFARPLMREEDLWDIVQWDEYRSSLLSLGGIYRREYGKHRIVIMPHGSKMETISSVLFSIVHKASLVFAMPRVYNPRDYSIGVGGVWMVPFGSTQDLVKKLSSAHNVPLFG